MTTESQPMQTTSDRNTAIIIGMFFILATAMGVTNAILLGPLVGAENPLITMSENAGTVGWATLLNLIMAGAVVAIAVVIYPVLKRSHETLAVGYLAARIVEGIMLALAGASWLALSELGQAFVQAGMPDGGYYQTLGQILLSGGTTTFTLGAEIVFGLTALILNFSFIQTRIIPRWLSIWGFVGGALLLSLGVLKILGLSVSGIEIAFTVPIALNEMVLAIWLIAIGFAPVATANQ